MLELILAKLAALGVGAKVAVGAATAASVVAVGGATGVVPVLPEKAERPAVEQQVRSSVPGSGDSTEGRDAAAKGDKAATEAPDQAPDQAPDRAPQGSPAPQASFGQSVATDARDGGVDGAAVSEQARQRPLPAQADKGQQKAAEGQARRDAAPAGGSSTTGSTQAEEGQARQEQPPAGGQQTGEDRARAGADNGKQGRDRAPRDQAEPTPAPQG